ncbi:MAG: SGNH/GDSL hydrolase family protein [Lentisphaeria bacterium]|nr:SGNH/GDSL hydrolase family protein [Lentisphaeria bacterium]
MKRGILAGLLIVQACFFALCANGASNDFSGGKVIGKRYSSAPARNGFLYRDVKLSPFKLEGLAWFRENNREYFRIPLKLTEKEVNDGVIGYARHTAGVTVRFKSDSPVVMIRATLVNSYDMNHMTRAGSAGFDSYFKRPEDGRFLYNTTVQPNPGQKQIEAVCGINPENKMCEWIINFPLYGGVSKVEIGLKVGSSVYPPAEHKVKKPILFYGSSITQGGCASRPGNAYSAMLCRAVDAEQINLGFSGSAKGEAAIAELIAKLDLAAFVFDYDHNTPSLEHLQNTHEKFFRIIREAHPQLPVIIVSKCDFAYLYATAIEGNKERRDIIRKTWENAVARGDKNVYFVDGETLFAGALRDCCTVDGTHPNDLGFFRMYSTILPVLEKALGRK